MITLSSPFRAILMIYFTFTYLHLLEQASCLSHNCCLNIFQSITFSPQMIYGVNGGC